VITQTCEEPLLLSGLASTASTAFSSKSAFMKEQLQKVRDQGDYVSQEDYHSCAESSDFSEDYATLTFQGLQGLQGLHMTGPLTLDSSTSSSSSSSSSASGFVDMLVPRQRLPLGPVPVCAPEDEELKLKIHEAGQCRPCLYLNSRVGCLNYKDCRFCHLPHLDKKTVGISTGIRQSKRFPHAQLAAAALAGTSTCGPDAADIVFGLGSALSSSEGSRQDLAEQASSCIDPEIAEDSKPSGHGYGRNPAAALAADIPLIDAQQQNMGEEPQS